MTTTFYRTVVILALLSGVSSQTNAARQSGLKNFTARISKKIGQFAQGFTAGCSRLRNTNQPLRNRKALPITAAATAGVAATRKDSACAEEKIDYDFYFRGSSEKNKAEDDEYSEPRDFSKAKLLIKRYVEKHNLSKDVQQTKINAVCTVLKSFDVEDNHNDAKAFDYTLWQYPEESEELLNMGRVDFKLDFLCSRLKDTPPEISITGNAGLTPLGGPRAVSSSSTPLYGILKFIGQYTSDEDSFEQCIETVTEIADKIEGRIRSASEVLFLMGRNKHFSSRYQFPRPQVGLFHKKRDFKESIYCPNPVQTREHEEVRRRFGRALAKLPGDSAKLLLMQAFLDCHYHLPKNINELVAPFRLDRVLLDKPVAPVQYHTILGKVEEVFDVSEFKRLVLTIMEDNKNLVEMSQSEKAHAESDEIVDDLGLDDSEELMDVIQNALVYVKDEDLEGEYLGKRLAFEKLFTSNIIPIDSDMAHYAMRRAAESGRVWAVTFLIDQGVSVNPPVYEKFRMWRFDENRMSPYQLASRREEWLKYSGVTSTGDYDGVMEILKQAGCTS